MSDDGRISITISFRLEAEHEFSPDDLWPDGDAPGVITPEAVAAMLRQDGQRKVFADWNILDYRDLEATVSMLNPEWQPGPALFPELAPARSISAEVWA